jgi:GNAT superfamily N-acetyltransferase
MVFRPMATLRDATEHDVVAIARLHADSWRSAYRGILSDEYLDSRAHSERAALWQARFSEKANKPFLAILAEAGAQLVGFACVFPHDHPTFGSFLDNLHVAPQNTRQGIGGQLLGAVAARLAKERTPGGLYLWVIEKNSRARRFYAKAGAIEVETVAMPMADGTHQPEVRCYWPILPASRSCRTANPYGNHSPEFVSKFLMAFSGDLWQSARQA